MQACIDQSLVETLTLVPHLSVSPSLHNGDQGVHSFDGVGVPLAQGGRIAS